MQTSESLKELATALAEAQGEMENASKNATNPHFGKNYADLAEVLNTVRPVLAKHGLAVVQLPGWDDGRVTVETMLTHKSGEWIKNTASTPIPKADPQGVGSAVTYLRRYSLAALCAIAQEDDDASTASTKPTGRTATKPAKTETPPNAAAHLRRLAKSTDPETAAEIETKIVTGLTVDEAQALYDEIKARFAVAGNGATT